MTNNRFVILDVETTGLLPQRGDRVIEIGAISIETTGTCSGSPKESKHIPGIRITGEFNTLIHTHRPISRRAQYIHGIFQP